MLKVVRKRVKAEGTKDNIMRTLFEKEELDDIADDLVEGVCKVCLDDDFTLIYGNKGFYNIFGYTEEEMRIQMGNRLIALFYQRDMARIRQIMRECYEKKSARKSSVFQFETRIKKRDDKIGWLYVNGVVQKEKGIHYCKSIVLDITKQKQAEELAAKNKEKLKVLSHNIGSTVFEYYIERRMFVHPEGALAINYCTPEELIRQGIIRFNSARDFLHMCDCIEKGIEKSQCIVEVRTQGNEYRWKRIQMAVSHAEWENERWAIGIMDDVTEQKKTEYDAVKIAIYKDSILSDTEGYAEINVSNDIIEKLDGVRKKYSTPGLTKYSDYIDRIVEGEVHPKDKKKYKETFNSKYLMSCYKQGKRQVSVQYCKIQENKQEILMMTTCYLIEDPISKDIKGIVYVRMVDKEDSKKERKKITKKESEEKKEQFINEKKIEDCLYEYVQKVKHAKTPEEILTAGTKSIQDYYGNQHIYIMKKGPEDKQFSLNEKVDCFKWEDVIDRYSFLDKMEALQETMIFPDIERIKFIDLKTYEWLKNKGVQSLYGFFVKLSEVHKYCIVFVNPSQHKENVRVAEIIRMNMDSDIEKLQAKRSIEHIKYRDLVTGAANRLYYNKYISKLRTEELSSMGIVILQIGGLRNLNQTYGDIYGDAVLKENSNVLIRNFSTDKVFRIGQDKFMAVGENISQDNWKGLVGKIVEEIHQGKSDEVFLGARWCNREIEFSTLLEQAEELMLIEKNKFYQERQRIGKGYRLELLQSLRKDIEDGKYKVYLQPKVDLSTRHITGAESLIRRENKAGDIESPAKFIPTLEKAYLVRFVDLFVYEEVCKMLANWKRQKKELVPIALNFSRITLLEQGLISTLCDIAEKYEVDTSYIEVEITETVEAVEAEALHVMSKKLKEHGFRVTLDDFGTKYTNLSVLSTMEVDVLKLDKSLIESISDSEKNKVIVRSVVDMCRQLGVETVAEGIETKEQESDLEGMNCTYGQGYLFYRPMPQIEFEKIIKYQQG